MYDTQIYIEFIIDVIVINNIDTISDLDFLDIYWKRIKSKHKLSFSEDIMLKSSVSKLFK